MPNLLSAAGWSKAAVAGQPAGPSPHGGLVAQRCRRSSLHLVRFGAERFADLENRHIYEVQNQLVASFLRDLANLCQCVSNLYQDLWFRPAVRPNICVASIILGHMLAPPLMTAPRPDVDKRVHYQLLIIWQDCCG